MHYEICWVGEDGLYGCGHAHPSVQDAARHMAPSGRSFIRACESGAFRSLNDGEFIAFLAALRDMPWRSPEWGKPRGAGAWEAGTRALGAKS